MQQLNHIANGHGCVYTTAMFCLGVLVALVNLAVPAKDRLNCSTV